MDLAKEVNEELLKRIARYEHHLETARKSARKYYLKNKDAIRAKNKQRYKSTPEERQTARDRYYKKKMQRMEQKMNGLLEEVKNEVVHSAK
jgi:uncharacterized FlaG/YvyC family protein